MNVKDEPRSEPSALARHAHPAAEAPPEMPTRLPDAPHGHVHRDRDFGIGYGNSSGYGSPLHFTDGHVDALFRFR